jgi:fascin 1
LRKRYARLENDEIHVDELIPWGSDCLITVEFREDSYAIRTSNGMYLSNNGKLVYLPSDETLFNVEFHKGCVAFKVKLNSFILFLFFYLFLLKILILKKHKNGKYLTAIGPQGIITARSKSVTKDELFLFDSNHAQVSLLAFNGKLVSVKQGVDVSANQFDLSDNEIFQLEEDSSKECWNIRTNKNNYWKLESNSGGGGIQATEDDRNQIECSFQLIYVRPGEVALKASNNKYVIAAATGHMRALSDQITEQELFRISLVNRPILVLKCEYGLVGYKNTTSYKLECNKSTFNVIMLEEVEDMHGFYCLKGSHGLYWNVTNDETISANNTIPTKFSIELLPNNRMLIRGPNKLYLRGEQSGLISSNVNNSKMATQWEF